MNTVTFAIQTLRRIDPAWFKAEPACCVPFLSDERAILEAGSLDDVDLAVKKIHAMSGDENCVQHVKLMHVGVLADGLFASIGDQTGASLTELVRRHEQPGPLTKEGG